ncbi:MAG TPA: Sec-independent protein translocase protein TatB [Gammaproteobacteria bacterium]|nr:Sec-independent protein translocase protein TatB [Gammaproteobacteria bacterium]
MFDIGPGELLLVAIIGLLVLGPQRLPKVAAEIGKWDGRARRTASQLRRQLEREIELSELETPPPAPPPPPAATPSPAPAATNGSGQATTDAEAGEANSIGGHAASSEPSSAAEKREG